MTVNNTFSTTAYTSSSVVQNSTTPPSTSITKSNDVSIPVRNPVRTALNGLASYKDLLSRAAPLMSDEAFIEKAKEQAQKDFANNVFQGLEFYSLNSAFISIVSPDRAGMIENAIKDGSPFSQKRALHLWEIMLQLEKGKGTALSVSHYEVNPDGNILSMTICDFTGTPIIRYDHIRGWDALFTPEELARSQKLYQVYNDAWRQAKSEAGSFDLVPGDLGIGSFDASA